MRVDPDHFSDSDPALVYVAKKLKLALRVEEMLTAASIDYVVETDRYTAGFLFRRERVGAFFYVSPEHEAAARETLRVAGFEPFEAPAAPSS